MTLDGYCELEGDDLWCNVHDCKRPCPTCADDHHDRQFEERRERITKFWGVR